MRHVLVSGKGVSKMNEREKWREVCKAAHLQDDLRQLEEVGDGLSGEKRIKWAFVSGIRMMRYSRNIVTIFGVKVSNSV